MSTATPRLQLTKPLGSESMVLGASQLSDAYSKIDAAIGVKKFATQGAATATFNGDLILETSTGQSKLFNSPNWMNIFDPNNARGRSKNITTASNNLIVSGFPEQSIGSPTLVNVESGRKYLVNFNLSVSAQDDGGTPQQGYIRFFFRYATNLSLATPDIFIHDAATYVNSTIGPKSKSFKGMFEFFPNISANVNMGLGAQIITGAQDVLVNLTNSIPSLYLTDWGV